MSSQRLLLGQSVLPREIADLMTLDASDTPPVSLPRLCLVVGHDGVPLLGCLFRLTQSLDRVL